MGLTLTYDPNIPLPGDNPSESQGEILTNFASIGAITNSWTTQDHFGFGTGNDGQHLQLNFPNTTGPFSPGGISSVVYTAPGTASSSTAELFLKNSGALLLLSSVKAFGSVNGVSGALLNGFNASVSHPGTGMYSITISSGVVTGTNYAVFLSSTVTTSSDRPILTYTITSSTNFNVLVVDESGPFQRNVNAFSFLVLQL